MPAKKPNVYGLKVGADKDAVDAARRAVMEIVKAPAGDSVKKQALKTMLGICSTDNNMISHCNFNIPGDSV